MPVTTTKTMQGGVPEVPPEVIKGEGKGTPEAGMAPDTVPLDLAEDEGLDDPIIKSALQGNEQWHGEALKVARELAAQPKVQVYLPQNPPGKQQLPPHPVQINDVTFRIPRGAAVKVPQEVARILDESGARFQL